MEEMGLSLPNDRTADDAARLRDSLRVGDRIMYRQKDSSDCEPGQAKIVSVPCRIVRKYPHLVEVAGADHCLCGDAFGS